MVSACSSGGVSVRYSQLSDHERICPIVHTLSGHCKVISDYRLIYDVSRSLYKWRQAAGEDIVGGSLELKQKVEGHKSGSCNIFRFCFLACVRATYSVPTADGAV
jgi:hypothetical protein